MPGAENSATLGVDIGGTSVKAVVMEGEREVWSGRSGEYARPGRGELVAALRELLGVAPREIGAIGVCAPGARDERGVIVRAMNVPGIEGTSGAGLVCDVLCALGTDLRGGTAAIGGTGREPVVREFTDAHAAAVDWWRGHRGAGRLLALSMGTGIGASVLEEDGSALIVSGGGPGHVGQMDVGEMEEENQGTRAGKPVARQPRTLEGCMGLPALRARFGGELARVIERGEMRADRLPLSALVRALRVCHAIYRPQRLVLLGGVGIRMGPVIDAVRAAVAEGLTELAREGWTLEVGDSDFHAARGAAWMAGRGGNTESGRVSQRAEAG